MRIQIASDLHLEFLAQAFPGFRIIEPDPRADVLVLAGDIHAHTLAIAAFADWPVPVVYVLGNHEFYGHELRETIAHARTQAAGTRVHFLECETVVIDGVRFVGTTLWTDYELFPGRRAEAMDACEQTLLDHKLIRASEGPFLPVHARAEHQQARTWLAAQLRVGHAGPTVVVTHHGPHPRSVHPRYANDPVSAGFVSDLGALAGAAPLWIHGHVHDSFDYAVDGTRVIANPRGYAYKRSAGRENIEWENAAFLPNLVVEVN